MGWTRMSFLVGLLIWGSAAALADEPPKTATGQFLRSPMQARLQDKDLQLPTVQLQGKQPGKEKLPLPKDKAAPPQADEELIGEPPTPTEAVRGPNPNMMGDQMGQFAFRSVLLSSTGTVVVTIPARQPPQQVVLQFPTTVQRNVRVPISQRGGIKIAENESPAPQDRVFFTYNYYNGVRGPNDGSTTPTTVNQTFFVAGVPFTVPVSVPGLAPPRLDVHRETFGFEKTFLDGDASVGLRVPFFQQYGGDGSFSEEDLGDMTIILKYAPLWDRELNNVISLGLAITVPTGPDIQTASGTIHPTLLQPYLGWMFTGEALFVQGFTSVVVPTDSRDVTLLFNDIGVGLLLLQGGEGLISSVVPMLEAHVTTPMDHRSQSDSIRGIDLVVLTAGVHLGLGTRSALTLGVATPITGPRPFAVEGLVQLNFRF